MDFIVGFIIGAYVGRPVIDTVTKIAMNAWKNYQEAKVKDKDGK